MTDLNYLSGEYMTNYMNYFLTSKASRLTQGHLKANQLYEHILNHNGNTAYCCYFDLDEKMLKLEWDTGKFYDHGWQNFSTIPVSNGAVSVPGSTMARISGKAAD